jgi:hypothetical protein
MNMKLKNASLILAAIFVLTKLSIASAETQLEDRVLNKAPIITDEEIREQAGSRDVASQNILINSSEQVGQRTENTNGVMLALLGKGIETSLTQNVGNPSFSAQAVKAIMTVLDDDTY